MQTICAAVAVATAAIALAGCEVPFRQDEDLKRTTRILGSRVSVVVTTDGGKELVVKRNVPIKPGMTALDALTFVADVRMGVGGSIRSINGIGGGRITPLGPEQSGWFYRINGIEANVRADRFRLKPGTNVWFDLRRFDIYERLPVAIGVFPEPLLRGYRDTVRPLRISYGSEFEDIANDWANGLFERLEPEVRSIELEDGLLGGDDDAPKPKAAVRADRANLVIARWEEARLDPYIADIGLDPRGWGLTVWVEGTDIRRQDPDEEFSRELDEAEGFVWASTIDAEPDSAIVFLVSGTTDEGVEAAAEALNGAKLQYWLAGTVDREGTVVP
jgi:hypothetical protein